MSTSSPHASRPQSSSPPSSLKITEDNPPEDLSPPESSKESPESQHYCLKWNNYQTNLTSVFDQLLQTEAFVDVTLTSEGQVIKCHKVVLSACSPYFQSLLADNPSQHPIVILRDITWNDLKYIVEYMYKGEINVSYDELPSVLKSAEALNIRGLVEFGAKGQGDLLNLSQDMVLRPTNTKFPPPLVDYRPHKRKRTDSLSCDGPPHPGPAQQAPGSMPYPTNSREKSRSPPAYPAHVGGPASPFHARGSHASHSPPSSRGTPQTGAHPPSLLSLSNNKSMMMDDLSDVKPGIMELIQEERRAKLLEASQITQSWMNQQPKANAPSSSSTGISASGRGNGANSSTSPVPGSSSCYQYQLQNMWQKCWNQNASVMQSMRYRERGPMKSWRPETMAEAIWSVLQEGLSLSQAARKHDIPYPTFVLYANRVHNMLGPSVMDGSPTIGELRPKGRGRPQRILLGNWPEEHVRQVIRAVVFRDGTMPTYQSTTAPLSTAANTARGHSPTLLMRSPSTEASRPSALSPGEEAALASFAASGANPGALSSAQEKLAAQFQHIYNTHLNQFATSLRGGGSRSSGASVETLMVKPEKENLMQDSAQSHASFRSKMTHSNGENFEDADDDYDGDKRLVMDDNPCHRRPSACQDHDPMGASSPRLGDDPNDLMNPHNVSSSSGQQPPGSKSRDLDESIFKLRERRMKMMMLMGQPGSSGSRGNAHSNPHEEPEQSGALNLNVQRAFDRAGEDEHSNLVDAKWDYGSNGNNEKRTAASHVNGLQCNREHQNIVNNNG